MHNKHKNVTISNFWDKYFDKIKYKRVRLVYPQIGICFLTEIMYQRRARKFRRRPNGRNYQSRNSNGQSGLRSQLFSNDQPRNNFRTINNPEKMLEKFSTLAKEALSAGDKTLSENYLQHADHYIRIIGDRNKNHQINKDQNKNNTAPTEKSVGGNIDNSIEKNTQEKK